MHLLCKLIEPGRYLKMVVELIEKDYLLVQDADTSSLPFSSHVISSHLIFRAS